MAGRFITFEGIDGAGKSMVMLTLASDGEASYAADIRSESAVGERTTESSYEKTYLIIDGANGETGLIQKTTAPEVRGVAVVCEGGGSAAVKREITETISAAAEIAVDFPVNICGVSFLTCFFAYSAVW